LAEFLRRRELPGWGERTLQICARHPGEKQFERIHALAILSLALGGGLTSKNGRSAISATDIDRAASEMTALAERMMTVRFGHHHDLVAYLNNAAVLLRLAGQDDECEALLKKGITVAGPDPFLLRILALSQASQGKKVEALETMRDSDDNENRMLAADFIAIDRPMDAIERLKAIDTSGNIKLECSRLRAIGETASRISDIAALNYAIDNLREIDVRDPAATLFEIRRNEIGGDDIQELQTQLSALVQAVPDDADLLVRLMIAEQAMRRDMPSAVITLLHNRVDFSRQNPATTIFLQALGGARRDKEFRDTLASASDGLRNSSDMLWTAAAHAWNVGDIEEALTTVRRLLAIEPDNPRVRLFLVEILIRLDRSSELVAELDKPVEHLPGLRLRDRFRLASLLQHLGYPERAVALAYRLFLENRDNSQAWTTLSILVIEDGVEVRDPESLRWRVVEVADDVAVNLEYEDGTKQYVIVEPDRELRSLDAESWEPDHPLICALKGLKVGDSFVDQAGRSGKIIELQHKYVSRCHQVMLRHKDRFPTIDAFRSISVDPTAPHGLDAIIEEFKSRREWADHEIEQYLSGPLPLGVFAHRVGCDTIDAADGIFQSGRALKVSTGTIEDLTADEASVRRNQGRGCVTDLQTFHTMWRLGIIEAITKVCGRIHIPQSVLDRLKIRREHLHRNLRSGSRSGRYENGKIALQEVPPDIIQSWLSDLEPEIAWLESNAAVCPLILDDRTPAILRDYARTSRTDIFDALTLSIQLGMLFASDDLPTRQFRHVFAGDAGCPLHAALAVACTKGIIDSRRHTQLTAGLIDLGYDHVPVNNNLLLTALDMDLDAGLAPGPLFKTLIRMLGGKKADSQTHVLATAQFMAQLWHGVKYESCRNQASSQILDRMISERVDYKQMVRTLILLLQSTPAAANYIRAWAIGHFIAM
jgi:tetratricopeptide (TPR) repeat protein